DLAETLADLMDEMRGEGVTPADIAKIDVSRHSAHWQRTQEFIGIISQFFAADAAPDVEARQRMVTERMIARWKTAPPQDPVIIAGSTGSRGTTRLLMQAVAGLPQGVLVLPGFDFDMPPELWAGLADARTGEDHPQFRYSRLMEGLGIAGVGRWVDAPPPSAARNRLVSLSLRPAPVTDQWLVEGGRMDDLAEAAAGMTLIVAPTPRAEAVAIALVLRKAVADGRKAALMTPDRNLTRRVTAVLDGWGIRPDDSAGEPLTLAPTGRYLRVVAGLFGRRVTGEALLALLKHPAVARGDDRGGHLRFTQALEISIREKGVAFPDAVYLRTWALGTAEAERAAWGQWLAGLLDGLENKGLQPLAGYVAEHLALAEALARGPAGADVGSLWVPADGIQTRAAVAELEGAADAAGSVTPQQFGDILQAVLQRGEVRTQGQDFPDVMIWGTREARIQGADLVILGGLNDGIWPALPPPDPWLNRDMRMQAGLLLPE
ncbi:MAG: double-strand break repair protein AddB, partial [Paracoccaceae bacterium]